MYHRSGMQLKLTMAPSICRPRLTLPMGVPASGDGLTDATSNSGRAGEVWLKAANEARAPRRTHRIELILYFTIRGFEKIHESSGATTAVSAPVESAAKS